MERTRINAEGKELFASIKGFGARCIFGVRCFFDEGCIFGEQCNFGALCFFGEGCSFGERCFFGALCIFDEGCSFGAWCFFGGGCIFGERCDFGKGCIFDAQCRFDERCIFDERCSYENGAVKNGRYVAVDRIGSKNRKAYFYIDENGNMFVRAGCWFSDMDAFKERVKKVHAGTTHEKTYLAACDLAELMLKGGNEK